MNVQSAAAASGLPAKTIRYYDEIGLVTPGRRANGYRDYDDRAVQKLAFLKRARQLGFSIDDCRQLLSLYEDKRRASKDVRALAGQHLAEIDMRLNELHALRATLADLVDSCHGDSRPDCPILTDLAGAQVKKVKA
tara:strand:+ start:422 stop:829 length:408 start_codon:yes stop_codon:yes gene_type:complete